MSEIIGTFELDHICNTFTTDENNMITNHTNWRGTAEGFGELYNSVYSCENSFLTYFTASSN